MMFIQIECFQKVCTLMLIRIGLWGAHRHFVHTSYLEHVVFLTKSV